MQVGAELKAARKKAGISVEVIAQRTKISLSRLVALEKNDFKNLPTGLYLFSTVRAYAREVHIDPEPIVERLRAEFADQDALDALLALDASGALAAKNLAHARKSKEEHGNRLRNAAVAAGLVLMATAGAGAYVYNAGRIADEIPAPLPSPPPAATIAAAIHMPPQVDDTPPPPAAPAQTHTAKPRSAPAVPGLQETTAAAGAPAAALGSSGATDEIERPAAAQVEEPSDTPADIEEPRPDATNTQ